MAVSLARDRMHAAESARQNHHIALRQLHLLNGAVRLHRNAGRPRSASRRSRHRPPRLCGAERRTAQLLPSAQSPYPKMIWCGTASITLPPNMILHVHTIPRGYPRWSGVFRPGRTKRPAEIIRLPLRDLRGICAGTRRRARYRPSCWCRFCVRA